MSARNDPRPHVARNLLEALKPVEVWRRIDDESDLWHNESGIIVNTAALDERGRFFRVVRLGVDEALPLTPPQPSVALGL